MPLAPILSGDDANAAQLQQIIDLLTGVMVDQVVSLLGGLTLDDNSQNTVPTIHGTVSLGVRIFVQPTAPVAPNEGDIWIQA
jgi:hypothetical protein